jgi:hypothetical protein
MLIQAIKRADWAQEAEHVFADWQPVYAKYGIATLPVRFEGTDKIPGVKNPERFGLPASSALAKRARESGQFRDHTGLGFYAGRYSKITVVDVDTPDERVFLRAQDEFGESPFIVRTGSRKFHAYYRHNGEPRAIRPFAGEPIDILGGGLCVAPPSRGPKGPYEIIQGTHEDLANLPLMRRPDQEGRQWRKAWQDMREHDGRNERLSDAVARAAHRVDDMDALLDYARTRNDEFAEPLDDGEVVRMVRGWWNKTVRGENWCGVGKMVVTTHSEIDALLACPDALVLYQVLRRHHWGRDFYVANGMHTLLPGWGKDRLVAARKWLAEEGFIIQVKKHSQNKPGLYRWPPRLRLRDMTSNKKQTLPPNLAFLPKRPQSHSLEDR